MSEKPSSQEASEPLLKTLRNSPLAGEAVKQLEGRIPKAEVRKAIRSMANRKAHGPDGVHAEFYKTHEH
eukprot:5493043-Prymnesium_polylepis.1